MMSYLSNRKILKKTLPKVRTKRPNFDYHCYGMSHVGCQRGGNEDSFWMIPKHALWVVADGMGGYAGGQLASTLTVKGMALKAIENLQNAETVFKEKNTPIDLHQILTSASENAGLLVSDAANSNPGLENMGSTLTAMLLYEDSAYLTHVGDSRAYLFRAQELSQITEDHSWVQSRVNLGQLSPEAALTHRMRNLILKSISGMNYSQPDIAKIPVEVGDCFMLCSDGLVEHVMDFEINQIFKKYHPSIVPHQLIALANSRGGSDNSTVVVVQITQKHNH